MKNINAFMHLAVRYLLPLAVIVLLLTAIPAVAQGPGGDPTDKQAPPGRDEGRPVPVKERAILAEDFEAGIMPPAGWTHLQTNPNETWQIGTYNPYNGSYHAHVLYDSALLDQDEVLLSPAFTADSGTVSLWSKGSLYWCRDTYDNCDLEVWFVNGSWDWGGGDDVFLGLADDDWAGTWMWSNSTFDFSPYASGGSAQIAFRYVGNDGAEIGLDQIDINYSGGGACGDPHEPNDSSGQATPIGYGTTLTDPDICPAGDEDYYAFTGSAGDTIAVDIDAYTALGSSLDPVLHLYDTDGVTELYYNDDYDGLDSYLEYTLPANGTYYLRVHDYGTPHGGPDYFYTISLASGGGQAQWSFMVYLDGDNNLEGAGIDDFMEMASVGSTGNVNILVQFDRVPGYSTSYGDWTSTKRFRVTAGMTPTAGNALQDIGEANMGDPNTLIDFVQWGMTNYPADHYAVILWDHGSGWRLRPEAMPLLKDVAYDDTSGGDALDMPELFNAMDILSNGGADPLDLVGFDACLMGMIEVDNQLIPYADVRVGSEETEPWDGWPYDPILSALTGTPTMSASQLGTVIVDEYYASYGNSETQSAVDLQSPYGTLNTAVNDFAVALINGVGSHYTQMATARANTQEFYYPTYIDLYDFAYQINLEVSDATINAAATAVMNAVNSAVIREQHGGGWPGAHGISIYFPQSQGAFNSTYNGSTGWLQFTSNTQWDEWLNTFYNPTPGIDAPWFDDIESGLNGWTADGFWHQVQDGVSPYPNSHSPTHSWWYGQDATGDYDNGAANSGSLTSPAINIPGGVPGASLSFWSWYETEPMLLPQSVYFDVYHDTDGDNISGGFYTDWANDLNSLGYTVVEYNQPIDLATLSAHQVLALFDPEIALSSAEITAINNFMQNGGRVIALGEWNDLSGTNTILNALSTAHGITFNTDTVYDSTDNDGYDMWPLITNFADEPPVSGINTVVLYASCSLSLSGSAVPLATGDNDAYKTVPGRDEAEDNDYGRGPSQLGRPPDITSLKEQLDKLQGRGFDRLAPLRDIVPGAPVVMAYTPVGAGELIAIGDSNSWTNDDPDGDGVMSLYEYSNQQLAFQFFGKMEDFPAYDQKWVQISVDGGPFQNLLQVTGWPMNTWHQINADLSPYVGSQVRLRFYFNTIDSLYNNYRGWYVDDVFVDTSQIVGPLEYNGHDIDDDNSGDSSGNNNGITDAGETIELYVELINNGAGTATNVEACISETSPYVNGFLYNTCAGYGNIPGGGTANNGDDFDFEIDPAAPSGHLIHFDLNVTADNGGPWSTSFDIIVGQGATVGPIVYVPPPVIDDDNLNQSVGNNDGEINPGETIELYVEAGNAGNTTALDVIGCISENSPYVNGFLFNVCSDYGDIPGGGTAINGDDFDFEVAMNTPDGHLIPFCMDFSATNGGAWTDCFGIQVNDLPQPGVDLRVEPPDQDVSLTGGTFFVNVVVEDVTHLGAFQFDLVYNPAIVQANSVALGPFLGSSGCSVSDVSPIINNTTGRLTYGANIIGTCTGPSGDGIVATVTFQPVVVGDSDLILENEQLLNSDDPPAPISPVNLYSGHVTVTNCFFADVDCDGDVDIADIYSIAYTWGCQCGDTCYVQAYDLNNDCAITIGDIQTSVCYFGWPTGDFSSCYSPTTLTEGPLAGDGERAVVVQIEPPVISLDGAGEVFTITVEIDDANDLGGFQFDLNYDLDIVQENSGELGIFLGSSGRTVHWLTPIDITTDTVRYGAWTEGSLDGPNGSGTLTIITLETRDIGHCPLNLRNVRIADTRGNEQLLADQSSDLYVGVEPSPPGTIIYLPIIFKDH